MGSTHSALHTPARNTLWKAVSRATSVRVAAAALLLTVLGTQPAAAQPAVAQPAAASAAATATENAAPIGASVCEISDAQLSWGVKESFRGYISGSIAQGEWEVSDGASYETPSFAWNNGAGSFSFARNAGSLAFTGTILFSGHGEVLNLELKNPEIEFTGDSASLYADMRSNDAAGEEVVNEQRVELATIEVSKPEIDEASGTATLLDAAPAVLTAAGAPAFADFYAEGDELDPLTVVVSVGAANCAEDPDAAGSQAWLMWTLLGVAGAVVIIAAVVTLRIARKGRAA